MQGESIFGPFMGMLLLTLVVWVVMYVRRLRYVIVNNVKAQSLATTERVAAIIPEEVGYPAYNLRNLFELPVVFYALCLYLYATQSVDAIYVNAAWLFLGFRILHSLIQCTNNIVMARFLAYMAASLALWFMVLRAMIAYF